MRPQSRSGNRHSREAIDEQYFERKARELVAPDDEIEAWELDDQDLGGISIEADPFGTPGCE